MEATVEMVEMVTTVPVAADDLWWALTDPAGLEHWLGTVVRTGSLTRVEFGPVDYYEVAELTTAGRRTLGWRWSYLGIAEPSLVSVQVDDLGHESRLRVAETIPASTSAALRRCFWEDLVHQLWQYLVHGVDLAGQGIRDIELERPLAGSTATPLHRRTVTDWLPVSGPNFPPSWFFAIEREGPWRVPIAAWEAFYDEQLRLVLDLDGVCLPATLAVYTPEAAPGELRLRLVHSGWGELASPRYQALRTRGLFEVTWKAALERGTRVGGTTRDA